MTTGQDSQTFVGDPHNYLFGIFENDDKAEEAAAELTGGSFTDEQVKRFEGPAAADELDSTGSEHGFGAKLLRSVQHLFTNLDHLSEYEEAARDGKAVLAVHIEEGRPRDEALEVFQRHGARFVNFYGNAVVETLVP